MTEIDRILSEMQARCDGSRFGCLCGLPGCQHCAGDAEFDRHARADEPRLIAALRVAVLTLEDLAKFSPRVRETLAGIEAALKGDSEVLGS